MQTIFQLVFSQIKCTTGQQDESTHRHPYSSNCGY